MRCFLWIGSTLLLSQALLSQAVAADRVAMPATLDLPKAVRMALTSSPQLRRSDAGNRYLQAEYEVARSATRPHLAATAGQSVQTINLRAQGIDAATFAGVGNRFIPERFGSFGTFDARFVASADVMNLSERYRAKSARRQAEAGLSDHTNVRELITLEVVRHYVEALRFQAMAATGHEQLAAARALYTITSDRFTQGVASGLDRRRARRQVTSAQQAVYEAEAALDATKLRLSNLLNANITSEYELSDIERFFDASGERSSEVLDSALSTRPDYRAALARVESAELGIRAAKALQLPRLAVSADVGQIGRTAATTLTTYRVQGTVVVPVYFGGRASAEKGRAQAALDEAQAAADAIRSEVEVEVRIGLSALNSARLQVETAGETVALAEEEVDLSLTRFRGGVSDNSEVVLAQERLARARQDRIRALYNLNMARAAMHRSTGRAEETYGRAL